MVDSCGEVNLGWLEWVIGWEVDVQEVNTTSVWGVIWSHDCCLPMVLVLLVDWTGGAVGGGIFSEIDEFLLDSLES